MSKKISIGVALALMMIVAAVTLSVTMIFSKQMFNNTVSNITEREALYDKISEIDSFVRKNYNGNIDEEQLLDGISLGYMAGIHDTYGRYYSAEEYAEIIKDNEGQIVGIGITASKTESGYIKVEEVYPDSPAELAGIEAGELIVKVNDIDLSLETYEEGKNAISGKAGTTLSLVVRNGTEDRSIPEIVRRKVQKPTIYHETYDNVGYIKITDFNDATYDQFRKAVESLVDDKVQSLIFDLRNNGGGTVDSVIKMLDLLLPEGDIATATYKDGRVEVLGTSDASCVELPMVVLTNKGTASAAELFTQALKDYGVAKSVGEKTYGKGTMQVYHKLKDGSAIKLTIAKYNPPKSPNYDGVGIQPNYEVLLTEDQVKNFSNLTEETDPQLKKALELAKAGLVSLPEDDEENEGLEDLEDLEEELDEDSDSEKTDKNKDDDEEEDEEDKDTSNKDEDDEKSDTKSDKDKDTEDEDTDSEDEEEEDTESEKDSSSKK